jgi:hypothetical protein
MKTVYLALVMISFGLLQVTTYAYASLLAPKHSPDNSVGSGDDRPRTSDRRENYLHVSGDDHSRSRSRLTKAHRPQQARNIGNRSTSRNVANVYQPSSGSPPGAPTKIARNRTSSPRITRGAALDGQEFKNSRNRSTTSAIIRAPARTPPNAAVINGTTIRPKRVN